MVVSKRDSKVLGRDVVRQDWMGGTLPRPKVGSTHVGVAISSRRKAVQMTAIRRHHHINCPKVLMYIARFWAWFRPCSRDRKVEHRPNCQPMTICAG